MRPLRPCPCNPHLTRYNGRSGVALCGGYPNGGDGTGNTAAVAFLNSGVAQPLARFVEQQPIGSPNIRVLRRRERRSWRASEYMLVWARMPRVSVQGMPYCLCAEHRNFGTTLRCACTVAARHIGNVTRYQRRGYSLPRAPSSARAPRLPGPSSPPTDRIPEFRMLWPVGMSLNDSSPANFLRCNVSPVQEV